MDCVRYHHAYSTNQHAGVYVLVQIGINSKWMLPIQVGLAVGDIGAIQEEAELQKLALQVVYPCSRVL